MFIDRIVRRDFLRNNDALIADLESVIRDYSRKYNSG
jgi:hypothetical protein